MKTRLLRFCVWLTDLLPLHSNRAVARAWFDGIEQGKREVGIKRGQGGRFARLSR